MFVIKSGFIPFIVNTLSYNEGLINKKVTSSATSKKYEIIYNQTPVSTQ